MSSPAGSAAARLVVRRVYDDDAPVLLAHFRAAFGHWPKVAITVDPLDHLRWKMGGGYPHQTFHYVAELDGAVVAGQIHQLWPVKVGDQELLALRGWDASVLPEYRGQEIMTRMRAFMLETLAPASDFRLGSTGHPAMARLHGGERRRDFAHRWLALIRPLAVRAAPSAFKLRAGRPPKRLARSIRSLGLWGVDELRDRMPRAAARAWTVRTADRFDEQTDPFGQAASRQFDFAIARSQDLLNWRYADPRAGAFTIRVAEQDGRLLGYSVLRVQEDAGYLADLLALPGRLDVVETLVRDAVEHFRRSGVASAECWLLANHPYVPVLRSCGFLGTRTRRRPTFREMRAPDGTMAFLSEADARVHLTVGDMDFV